MIDLALRCHCGKIEGVVKQVSANSCNRMACYCKDCRRFANHLSADSNTLNEYGGTELYQVAPNSLRITQGAEHLACLRLKRKGIYRWYSACCNTPIANTVSIKLPFVSVFHDFVAEGQQPDLNLGKSLGAVHSDQALKPLPEHLQGLSQRKIVVKTVLKLLLWKLTGKGRPSPFFEDLGRAKVKPIILED
ncbi:hypothetical protein AHAT_34280 [Agarivorans sp. Toyoura001]|uniref:DUF6151 family protein n=1 Tax=Agarivorans sp. Toyoura001 TaxID=2283141 RepID=UPI0010E62FEE|nr:DUF6151 family protein [Agarivorans sp. Toyoura001]GDY27538.1 hypothetical protein AHAT_34280 [Agarivorans sp. Toyoura001]